MDRLEPVIRGIRVSMTKADLILAPSTQAPSKARQLLADVLDDRSGSEALPRAQLALSEVITNAVRHGGEGDVLVAGTPKQGYLCVQVTDTGDGFAPRPRAFELDDDDGGFGLFLVERLTRRWGLTREDSNTRVWFEFDFDAAAVAA